MDKLIIGCGYLGIRVARRWLDAGHRVWATTRNAMHAGELERLGIRPVICDVVRPESLKALPEVNTIVYTVGLDRTSGQSMREVYVTGLSSVLNQNGRNPRPVGRFIYVSSTGVYGQTGGEWVDETAATEPAGESGRIVLEAERALLAHRQALPSATVLRFAGIYGPGRLLRRKEQLKAGTPLEGDAQAWLNLIHVEDGAAAVLAVEDRGDSPVYNVCDNEPVRREVYFSYLADLLGTSAPRFESTTGSSDRANRRISNRKLRALGWEPRYPTFREGLRASLVDGEEM